MSYDGQKVKMGRMPIYILEVELTSCDNTYGLSPCTAAGASGSECYNCFGTCQDTANFTETTKTYKFSSTRIENGLTFPTIMGVSTAPTTLTPAKGIGMRSSCSVQLQDHTWTDVGVDPYVSTRAYSPDNQGSFWGRLLARDPYTEGRKMTLKTGYLDDNGKYDVNNFQSRTYFIDTVTGPDASGRVVITGKDILRFADSTKAQVPTVSQALLTADINTTVTSVGITDPYDDVKNAYDAGQAYIRIDDETMLITGISGSNPTYTLTVLRNALPGVYSGLVPLAEHKENATVQHCHYFNAEEIDDIIYYLLNTGAGIDASYLPIADWQTVIDYGLQSYQFTTLITEPTGVKDLLDELSEHSILMWWDERTQDIKMDSILNRSKDYGPFNDSQNIIADSVAVARDDAGRTSQVWLAFGHRNPVLEMDQLNNYTTIKISADLDLELSTAYGIKKVRTIYSRWLPTELGAVASEIANRLLNYYKVTKKVITMALDPKDDNAWTGALIGVATRQRQDATGAAPEYGYRVLEVTEQLNLNGARYKYVLQSTDQDFTRNGLIQPDSNTDDYSDASATVKSRYAFISPDSGTFSDGTAAYEIL
jgi:hypothetical protein